MSTPFLRRQCWPHTEKLPIHQREDFIRGLLGATFLMNIRLDAANGLRVGATHGGLSK